MRRYNLYSRMTNNGRFELIKDVQSHGERDSNSGYWAECFTWQELKIIVAYLSKRGWKLIVESVEENDLDGRIHIGSLGQGHDYDAHMICISGINIIMARDIFVARKQKTY